MPIITPAYPSMCATHNISLSTKKILLREMTRAAEIVEQIIKKRLTWKDLFSRHTFFTSGYKYYLSIVAASRTKEAQLIWSGLVESMVRLLVSSLEYVESVELAHPFNKGFERVHTCHTEDEVEKIKNGDMTFQIQGNTTDSTDDITEQKSAKSEAKGDEASQRVVKEQHTIHTTTFYIGIELVQGQSRTPCSPMQHPLATH